MDSLADLAGDVRLQAPCEDLVNDAVTVVRVVGFLPVIICGDTRMYDIIKSNPAQLHNSPLYLNSDKSDKQISEPSNADAGVSRLTLTFTVPVQHVQRCNEELVGVLLLVAS